MDAEYFMGQALEEAKKAYSLGEVPVGAVVVRNGEIIGRGFNQTETTKDPTAHAEMLALRQAAETAGGWRVLSGCMYVTLEPCPMCAGAIVLSRLTKVYIGTADPKTGACGSLMNLLADERLNHQADVETGVLQEECSQIIKTFFKELREKKKEKVD